MVHTHLRSFVDCLRREGELVDIHLPLDPRFIIPEIQRRVVANNGPALLFHKPMGASFPVATNLFGSHKRIDLAFGGKPEALVRNLVHTFETQFPPKGVKALWNMRGFVPPLMKLGTKLRKSGPVLANDLGSMAALPALTCWPEDGGPFVTLPLVYTQDPVTGKDNLGMYRVQIHGPKKAGMHIQIHRGGGNHYHVAENLGKPLPAAVYVGGPPALVIAAIAPLPEDVTELLFASLLQGQKLNLAKPPPTVAWPLIAEADFCIYGTIPPKERALEGPFGDHYGYYSLAHEYPFLNVTHVFHRPDAIFPATVVGRPPQEDHFIAIYLQDILSPLFPVVMKGVKDVFAFEESGVHSLAGAIVRERYHREAFTACMRVLGEGQLSLTKVLMATDADLDVRDFRKLFLHILARCDFRTDLHVIGNISMDTLDYSGPAINQGSKAIFLGLGDARFELENQAPTSFSNALFGHANCFCPGALVVKGPEYLVGNQDAEALLQQPEIQGFRMVFLHDDPEAAVKTPQAFLWHIFTRFEPAGDIYGRYQVKRLHLAFDAPLVVDCRLKPGYPKVLEPDAETVEKVDAIWNQLGLD